MKIAFVNVLDQLGPETKQILLHHLQAKYHLSLEESDEFPADRIRSALEAIFASAAPLIIAMVDEELRNLGSSSFLGKEDKDSTKQSEF